MSEEKNEMPFYQLPKEEDEDDGWKMYYGEDGEPLGVCKFNSWGGPPMMISLEALYPSDLMYLLMEGKSHPHT
jgi:hypothetical protein